MRLERYTLAQPDIFADDGLMTNYGNQWQPPRVSGEERSWAIGAHLSAVIAMVISAGWLSFVGPLIIWALKKDQSAYVRSAAAQSFNFNVSLWLMSIVGWIFIITIIGIPVGIVLLIVAFVLTLWHHIRATIAATNDMPYHYPFQIKLLS